MEQSDLNLLHTVPLHHLQTLIKSRRLPLSPKGPQVNTSAEPSSITITEIAQHLFNPAAIDEVLGGLGEKETLILHELVACSGRANSRDLALYLMSSGLINAGKEAEPLSISDSVGTASETTQEHPQGVPQYPIPHPHGAFELALRHLLLLGLLFWGKQTNFGGRDYTSGVYDGVLIVPQAVMNEVLHLQREHRQADTLVPARGYLSPRQDSSTFAGSVDEGDVLVPLAGTRGLINEGIHALQRTLYLYWSLVAATREGLPVVNNGLISRYALRQVMEQLGPDSYRVGAGLASALEGVQGDRKGRPYSAATPALEIRAEHEVPRLLFIRLLLMKLGLLQEQQGMLRAAPAKAFFSLPLLERARRCYRAWLENTFWNELMHLPEVIIRPGPAPLDPAHEEVVLARQTVVARVLHEQAGAWCDLPTFVAHTKLYAPYLLFPRRYGSRADRYSIGSNPYGWDFRLRRGWLTHREGWHLVEGGFIRAVISGPLYWLGLVDMNSEDNPTAFRLAEDISPVTSDVPVSIEEPPAGRLIVQPNFELVALAPVSEALLINLDRFAERTSLERIAQYRLTKASVTRAIQMGLHADAIQQTLEQASGSEIPQNVQYSLLEWERQARRIELWRAATLLEVDDPNLLDELFADVETFPSLGRRLSPTLVEVPRHQLPALQEALWQRNYLPALVSASAHDTPPEYVSLPTCEPQWRLCDDSLLQPLYAVTNLYLLAELERFSEADQATGWRRITPMALQRAREAGLSLEYIMRFLKDYCEAGMPNSFSIRLKLWGGGYDGQPTIQVEHTPLLALSPQVLQDLLADEELRELLGTEVAPQLRLVHVVPDKLERVIELLGERGFEVT